MMKDHLYLGSSPFDEECAQLGTIGYGETSRAQISAFRDQLAREYKAAHGGTGLPEGVELVRRSEAHDFGSYYELVAKFDDEDEVAVAAAYWLESNTPAEWDEQAAADLARFYSDKGANPDGSAR